MDDALPFDEHACGDCVAGAGQGHGGPEVGAVLADAPLSSGWLDGEHTPDCCPRCGGIAVCRWGRASPARSAVIGAQRWRCRACCRTFSAATGTVLAGIRAPRQFRAVVADMLGPAPSSCRHLAKLLGLDKMTVWAWRMKAAAVFAVDQANGSTAPVATACTEVRESRKASRMWVDYQRDPQRYPKPDRLRWVDYRLRGLTPPDWQPRYRIPVQFAVDNRGRCRADVLQRADAVAAAAASGRPANTSHAPCLDVPASAVSAEVHDRPSARRPDALPENRTCLVARPLLATPALDALRNSFRCFLGPFRGPATTHLPAYVVWFIARLSTDPIAS